MNDLINRQAAIDAIENITSSMSVCINIDECHGMKRMQNEAAKMIRDLPSVQPTLYGYKIEHLAYIARVMEKEGITADQAVRTFDDMNRAIKMIIDETQQKVEETLNGFFNQQAGGD